MPNIIINFQILKVLYFSYMPKSEWQISETSFISKFGRIRKYLQMFRNRIVPLLISKFDKQTPSQ